MMQMPNQQWLVPARTAASVSAASANDRNTLARLAAPHTEGFDCQAMPCPNVAATGNAHARSSSAWVRMTED
jgi:hypothetical protein